MSTENVEISLPTPGFVYAPVAFGQKAGFARISLDDQCIGEVPVYFGQTVEQQPRQKLSIWDRLFGGKSE